MIDIIEKLREDRKFFFCLIAFAVYSAFFALKAGFSAELYGYTSLGALCTCCGANVAQKIGLAWAEAPKAVETKIP